MAKSKTVFVCQECGYESAKWLGKCPACNTWSSMVEEFEKKVNQSKGSSLFDAKTIKLNEITYSNEDRISTGISELDEVLGGGLVEGSLILIGGEPGIGKSTLILQMCASVKIDDNILYVSGEESASQIKMRADRLGIKRDNLLLLSQNNIDAIQNAIDDSKPKVLIIDSIQTVYDENIASAPGSVSQVREITSTFMNIAKKQNITTVIIGHVTKDGSIAGPRVLEHMVDTVLYFEGETHSYYRILRGIKNRFGSTNEIGLFEMKDNGLNEVKDSSKILLSQNTENVAGSVIVCSMEGTRPFLVEIQSLVNTTPFGMPRRMANGLDFNKVILLSAVLEKRAGLNLHNHDIYVNVVSGLKLNEPAVDLGVAVAIVSSFKNINIKSDVVYIGEVGLTGEIRPVNNIEKRLIEAEKSGFKQAVIPDRNLKVIDKKKYSLDIVGVNNIREAVNMI